MAKLLHVLNGDSSLELFLKTKLEGHTIIWREMLSEGKSDSIVGSQDFWRNRKYHLHQEMGSSAEGYERKVISEFEKLENLLPYDEVVLWFEYDLFCQINLMAALSYLKQFRSDQKISLICIGEFPNTDKLLGLGQLDPKNFESLFAQRINLEPRDLNFADGFWKIYSSPNHQLLKDFIKKCPDSFEYLQRAILGHLQRFPYKHNGLNKLESNILQLINDRSGNVTINDVIREFLINDQVYGVGDMIFMGYLRKISPLYEEEDEKLTINPFGINVLKGKASFTEKREDYYFGGSNIKSFHWNAELKNIDTF